MKKVKLKENFMESGLKKKINFSVFVIKFFFSEKIHPNVDKNAQMKISANFHSFLLNSLNIVKK